MGGTSGGTSKSGFIVKEDIDGTKYINFKGVTSIENGGFCSIKTSDIHKIYYDMNSYDGICVQMRSAKNSKYKFYLWDFP